MSTATYFDALLVTEVGTEAVHRDVHLLTHTIQQPLVINQSINQGFYSGLSNLNHCEVH